MPTFWAFWLSYKCGENAEKRHLNASCQHVLALIQTHTSHTASPSLSHCHCLNTYRLTHSNAQLQITNRGGIKGGTRSHQQLSFVDSSNVVIKFARCFFSLSHIFEWSMFKINPSRKTEASWYKFTEMMLNLVWCSLPSSGHIFVWE